MPTIHFDEQPISISQQGYAKIAALSAVTHTPDERRDAILDVLFDEGLLCDICGMAVATKQAQWHEDVRLCEDCATDEPNDEEPPHDDGPPTTFPGDPGYDHGLLF